MHENLKHSDLLPSQKLKDYVKNIVLEYSEYLIITKKGSKKTGYCTSCNNEFQANEYKHNDCFHCPTCNRKLTVKMAGYKRGGLENKAYILTFEKSKLESNTLIAKGYYVSKKYYNYRESEPQYTLIAQYIFSKDKQEMISINPWGWGDCKWHKTSSIYDRNNSLTWAKIPYFIDYKSLESSIEGTFLQYSNYTMHSNNYNNKLLKYLELFSKYPQIELLEKLGWNNLIKEKVDKTLGSIINFRAKDLYKMLKLSKKDYREIVKNTKCGGLTKNTLRLYQIKEPNSKLIYRELEDMALKYDIDILKKANQYSTLEKIYRYFNKQKIKSEYTTYNSVAINYKDYLNDCQRLNLDLEDKDVLFPNNLYRAHQNTLMQIKLKADKALDELIKNRSKERERYNFSFKNLVAMPASSTEELIAEGKALCHCVGGYARRHGDGETNIIFIRHLNDISKPFFTMEVKNNKIVQVHGKNNCNPKDEVSEFVEIFKREVLENLNNKATRVA